MLADVLVEPQQAVAVGVHPLLAVEPFLDVGIERGGEADLARGDAGVAQDVELPPDEQAGGGGRRQQRGQDRGEPAPMAAGGGVFDMAHTFGHVQGTETRRAGDQVRQQHQKRVMTAIEQ